MSLMAAPVIITGMNYSFYFTYCKSNAMCVMHSRFKQHFVSLRCQYK